MIKVQELKGYKAHRAFNAFHSLMLGLKMLPMYLKEDYEPFLERIQELPDAEKKKVLLAAAQFVPLDEEEIKALLYFCHDRNNVPLSETIKNIGPDVIMECIVAVCFEISQIKIDFLTEAEKKN